jgi:hypothetical protein
VTVAPPVAVPAGVVYVPIAPHNPYLGPAKPKVVIVAFTDFESPDTKAVAAILKRAIDDHPQDLVLVLKNLPAPSHPGAVRAARALQAARRQDKAWEIYAELVAHTAALAPADLVRYATKVDLDVAKFKTDLDDPTVEQEVAADRDLATQVASSKVWTASAISTRSSRSRSKPRSSCSGRERLRWRSILDSAGRSDRTEAPLGRRANAGPASSSSGLSRPRWNGTERRAAISLCW